MAILCRSIRGITRSPPLCSVCGRAFSRASRSLCGMASSCEGPGRELAAVPRGRRPTCRVSRTPHLCRRLGCVTHCSFCAGEQRARGPPCFTGSRGGRRRGLEEDDMRDRSALSSTGAIQEMSIEYKDLLQASPESEEVSMKLWTPQSSLRPLYGLCAVCAALFCIIIALIISFRTTGEKPLDRTTEFQIGNLSESMKMKVGQLSQDGTKLMEKFQQVDAALKGLQADPAIGKLQSDMQRVLAAINRLSNQIKKLSNGSGDVVCPSGWSMNQLSCYLFSDNGKSWEDAKKTCKAKNSNLVVINTEEEQNFIFGITKGKYTWIGLTDVSGQWIWVDGTKYDSTPHNWIPGQPDNHFGHGLGGGEDCAHLHQNGQWNDDHCSRPYRFICEMNM